MGVKFEFNRVIIANKKNQRVQMLWLKFDYIINGE